MGYAQQDAQEFLRYLLEGLHEDVNRVTVKPQQILTDIDDSLRFAQNLLLLHSLAFNKEIRLTIMRLLTISVRQKELLKSF